MRRKNDPSLVVAYIRRSKEHANGQTLGLEAQRDSIEAWARREAKTLLAFYSDDGVSGSLPLAKRPALLDALADVREFRAGVVVVAKRDRIGRDVGVVRDITRSVELHGAALVSADGNGNGDDAQAQLQRNMIDSFAEYERGCISERTSAALARKRVRGERTGGLVPYGYDAVNGRLEPREDEQAILRTIESMRDLGASTIARELAARGFRNRRGNPIDRVQVVRLLTSGRKVA